MSNRRQIPFLHWHRNRDGTWTAWWKPSKRLRGLGWSNRKLGHWPRRDRAAESAAAEAAIALNHQLSEWEEAAAGTSAPHKLPAIYTFGDLVRAYQSSSDWTHELSDKTRSEYRTRLRQLEGWATVSGRSLPLSHIDRQMVQDLKDALLPVSVHKCAGTLRVLRLVLNWAIARPAIGLTLNATTGVKIPAVGSRVAKLTWDEVQAFAAHADALGYPILARAVRLGFWTCQRRSDLLAANRMAWRTLDNLDPRDRAVLADARGDVKGFRLRQHKTGVWVDCPLPPFLHAEVEAALEGHDELLHGIPQWKLQREARQALDAAGFSGHQFRDLRRSGMSFLRDKGADLSDVFAISGHMLLGKRTIADTYMPPDTKAACRAVAAALRTLARDAARERENG